jgi:CheY-like chemotaxis protein
MRVGVIDWPLYDAEMVTKMLLVDDGLFDVVLTRQALHHCKVEHEIIVAGDGAEALSQLKRTRFDLVILDIKMPRVDGFEVLKQLRATPATSRIPVIVVSGSGLEEDQTRASTLGATAYVHKAMNFTDFQSDLKATLAHFGFC